MDFLLEEEMIDLVTYCLQNPDSSVLKEKKNRIIEIGKELFADVELMRWKTCSLH